MPSPELVHLCSGLPVSPLPPKKLSRDSSIPHAPILTLNLSKEELKVSKIAGIALTTLVNPTISCLIGVEGFHLVMVVVPVTPDRH